ncbi:MAG: hypothetical protein L7U48_05085, partial [Candidatus Poseidoniaceae archaeon]|nr:hypothetical protein [Candidatus Poseidoniaceae archaeon]
MRNALLFALLMLTALTMPMIPAALEGGPAHPSAAWNSTETTFSDGGTEHSNSLCSGCSGSVTFDAMPGASLATGEVNLTLEPVQVSGQSVYGFSAGTLTGTPTNMS